MPAYVQSSAQLPITALYPGDSGFLFNNEAQPLTGTKSQAFMLTPGRFGEPQTISVELLFSGAPGAFNIQVQTADTDVDAAYVTETAAAATITAVGAPSTTAARAELTAIRAKFVRLFVSAQSANVVNLTAKVTR